MIRHYLSQFNQEARTAVCSVCGPTQVHVSRPRNGNPVRVYCIQRAREWQEKIYASRQQHQSPWRPMALLALDRFHFFEAHLPREQRISVLLETARPEEQAAELEKQDMYCNQCLTLVVYAYFNNTQVPEFQPFHAFF